MTPETPANIPWNLPALMAPPATHEAPGFASEGVQSLFIETLPHHDRPTRAFAWIGLPEGYSGAEKLPGMVLVHGGGGTAYEDWVRMWTARGYAAIAVDTCGGTPGGNPPPRPRHEFSGPSGWGGFDQVDEEIHDQWPYHAVADVILAHSLLRSLPEVDEERIGLTGISWGGYLTCIVSGLDHRFRFAAPVYGCGFLGENSIWLETFKNMGAERAGRWLELWDPSHYLPYAELPMLWVTGTNDEPYPMDSRQKSYRLPHGPRTLSIKPEMVHGHPEGQDVPEIFAFADAILRDGTPLPHVVGQGRDNGEAWVAFQPEREVEGAVLHYTVDSEAWKDRTWQSVEVAVDQLHSRVSAPVPDGATAYFFNLMSQGGLAISSEHEELP